MSDLIVLALRDETGAQQMLGTVLSTKQEAQLKAAFGAHEEE